MSERLADKAHAWYRDCTDFAYGKETIVQEALVNQTRSRQISHG
jgi:hypothetical protein